MDFRRVRILGAARSGRFGAPPTRRRSPASGAILLIPVMKNFFLRSGQVACLAFCLVGARAETVAPKPQKTPSPQYPNELVDTGISGNAEISLVVKADGTVAEATVQKTDHAAFGNAALAVINDWRFEPASRDGNPVDLKVTIPFRFRAPIEQQVNAAFKRRVYLVLPQPALTAKEFDGKLKVKGAVKPVYPKSLVGSKVEEKVEVHFVVAPDGTTVNPSFVGQPRAEFVAPALRAVALTTYAPPRQKGKPVYVEASTILRFVEEAPRGGRGGRGGRGAGGRDGDPMGDGGGEGVREGAGGF
jgi:TonB family protein